MESEQVARAATPLGPIPKGWRLVRLKDITKKIGSGATPKGGESVYLTSRGRFALIRSQNVFDRHFRSDGLAFISDKHADELQGASVNPGDILLNITGDGVTFARACQAPEDILPACVNQHVSVVRPDPARCLPGYLVSYLTHPVIKHYIESFNAGGSRRAITKGHIESFEVPLPPVPQQQRIAGILGSLDDKIDLNRRMNETLEAMARAIFKSWFVDFDPVRAKTEGRQPVGIDPKISALFPWTLRDSVLGSMPEGWREGRLEDIAEVVMGSSPPGDTYNETADGVPLVNGPVEFGEVFAIKRKWTTAPAKLCQPRDLIFCVRGSTTGRRVLADGVYCLGRGVCAIRSSSGAWCFTRQLVNSTLGPLLAKVTGSVFPNLNGPDLKKFAIVIPPDDLVRAYERAIGPLLELVWSNCKQSESLAAIRDALLPKLLSGEIRINDVNLLRPEPLPCF